MQKVVAVWAGPNLNYCQAYRAWIGDCITNLHRLCLYSSEDIKKKSVLKIFNDIAGVEEPPHEGCGSVYCLACKRNRSVLRCALRGWKEDLLASQFGICLDCVKSNRKSIRGNCCRLPHVKG